VNRTVSPPAGSGFDDTLPPFAPTIFIATNPFKISDPAFSQTPLGTVDLSRDMTTFVISKLIGGPTGILLQTGVCPGPACDPTYVAGVHTRLGIHSQITSSPLLVADSKAAVQTAYFTVFDPDFGCNGFSYVIKQEFTAAGAPVFGTTTVYAASPGASSGFVVTDTAAFVGQSGVGKNSAKLVTVPIPPLSLPGQPNFINLWWKEQK